MLIGYLWRLKDHILVDNINKDGLSQPVFQWRLKDHIMNYEHSNIVCLNPCFNGG